MRIQVVEHRGDTREDGVAATLALAHQLGIEDDLVKSLATDEHEHEAMTNPALRGLRDDLLAEYSQRLTTHVDQLVRDLQRGAA